MQRSESPAALEDGPRRDKNYRRYASNVERALSLFDTALQEWADYIAFLGRLLKALHSKPSDTTEIPHKSIVAKRLAQCLAPVLPSGVHQKTLEVYAYVFSVLGRDGLSKDLPLWLPGLSPTLSFASLSVKPALLSLFETFVVTLNPRILRSALKAIVLALLPGLEDETGEEFERTIVLLKRFRDAVSRIPGDSAAPLDVAGDQYFWQSLFLASITSSSRRQGALAFMIRELPNLGRSPDTVGQRGPKTEVPPEMKAVISPEPGILVRCLATGLHDEQLLVQRGFLDLLVSHLPLNSAVLSQSVAPKDLELLVIAAVSVVARREMSLNRRLWSWFLGPEIPTDKGDSAPESPIAMDDHMKSTLGNPRISQTEYFERYGLDPLISGILEMIGNDKLTPTEKARPFRICLSLMDRWEIGGLVVPRIFLPALESVWRYQEVAPSREAFAEVLRSANVFFDGIESSLIWAELTEILTGAIDPRTDRMKSEVKTGLEPGALLDLVMFVITKFNVREEEMLALHIPMAILALLISMRFQLDPCEDLTKETIVPLSQAFKIATQLLDVIPQSILASDSPLPGKLPSNSRQILDGIQQFYAKLRVGSEDIAPPIQNSMIKEAILHNASLIAISTLDSLPIQVEYLESATGLLEKISRKSTKLDDHRYTQLMVSLLQALDRCSIENPPSSFSVVAALVSMLETVKRASSANLWESDHRVRCVLPRLLTDIWWYTSPSRPQYNVEAVRCLWRIHWISPDSQLVEGSIAALLSQDTRKIKSRNIDIEGARRFVTLWAHSGSTSTLSNDRHSSQAQTVRDTAANSPIDSLALVRPLLLLLDSLPDQKTELSMFITSWLHSLPSIQRIIDVVIYRLHTVLILEDIIPGSSQSKNTLIQSTGDTMSDVSYCLYYLQTILNLLRLSTANMWAALSNPTQIKISSKESSDEVVSGITIQRYLTKICVDILQLRREGGSNSHIVISSLHQTAALLLHQMFMVKSPEVLMETGLEDLLLETLSWSVERGDLMLQIPLMDLVLALLETSSLKEDTNPTSHRRQTSRESVRTASQVSLSTDRSAKSHQSIGPTPPSPKLIDCLMLGISSLSSHSILEQWILFTNKCLPFYGSATFQSFMPLVDCFIKTVESVFHRLRATFEGSAPEMNSHIEHINIINALLNGLEQVLARGHDQLIHDEGHAASIRSPEQVQGFFGNMVSGVFAAENPKSRSATANNRLTVLLCFKDAVRISFRMWSWGDNGSGPSVRDTSTTASFNYTSLRLRNRTRRLLEHLFAAEALECLETLVEFWYRSQSASATSDASTVFYLLHALEGSRPKNTIPALFNAIYSRTNPNVLDPVRKSTLTSELSDSSLASFLVAYTESMEDDALDEIWADCMTFLRDVLGNPLPHRQTLPTLLQFTAILGEKINNTNFGEQRKMRRDIGELFVRLLAATFTIKPLAFPQVLPTITNGDDGNDERSEVPAVRKISDSEDVVAIIASILPNFSKVLVDTDRIIVATTTISSQILTPTIRWKTFPHNVTMSTVEILKTMSRIPEASKVWRKDVADAFLDPRFFCCDSLDLVRNGWMPVLRQWVLLDRDRMPDLLSRLTSPASAGIMFGVGASSARLEADRKAQLNLRRIALLILSADHDAFASDLHSLQDKLIDLMTATAASSPSSTIRAEVYMVIRSLILKITPVHLASMWPIISTELYEALSSLNPTNANNQYTIAGVLQAAKLLDTLILIAPDDFQLQEWLFITDTIDAVYRPPDWKPIALVDGVAERLDARAGVPHSTATPVVNTQQGRQPLLTWNAIHDVPKENLVDRVLRPFLRQLSIATFESTYKMELVDRKACSDDLLNDLFDETTLV